MNIEEIVAALQAIIDEAADRDLNDEEVKRYVELETQLATAKQTQEIRSRQEAYNTPTGRVNAVAPKVDEERAGFVHYLRTGQINSDLIETRAQGVNPDATGGYLVPQGFRNKIVERMKSFGGIANAAETLNTSDGRPLEYPTVDDTGVLGEIVAEHGTFAAGADVVFGTRTISAYKYMAGGTGNLPLKVSFDLLQDSEFNIESWLTKAFATRINRVQAVHFATGTGSGQPQGLVTPFTTMGAIASNAVGPTYAELLATVHALDPEYRMGASWVMNDASLAKIRALVDGNSRPLWQEATKGMESLPGGTLLGYPVIIDQAMPAMATSGKFLAFGDIDETYVVRRVKDIEVVVLRELYAPNGQVGYMAWSRADGAVQNMNSAVVRTAAA